MCGVIGRWSASWLAVARLRMLQEAEERRKAFVASLEAAREEGLSEELATIEELEVEVRAAINAVRKRRR